MTHDWHAEQFAGGVLGRRTERWRGRAVRVFNARKSPKLTGLQTITEGRAAFTSRPYGGPNWIEIGGRQFASVDYSRRVQRRCSLCRLVVGRVSWSVSPRGGLRDLQGCADAG